MNNFLILVAIIASTTLFGAPVGNPSFPKVIQKGFLTPLDQWIDFRVGYEGDFVADGRMEQEDQGHGRVDTYEVWTNSGTLTLNILERIDLYGVFGASKTEADWRFEDVSAGTITRIKLKTESNFLWAIGGRVILLEWFNTSLGFGGRYASSHYIPIELTSDGASQPVTGSHFDWEEWQLNLGISYQIHYFTPYIGAKYSNANAYLKDFSVPIGANVSGNNSFENRIPIGLFLGCTLSTGKYFMFNLEGRLIDEEAVTVVADFKF